MEENKEIINTKKKDSSTLKIIIFFGILLLVFGFYLYGNHLVKQQEKEYANYCTSQNMTFSNAGSGTGSCCDNMRCHTLLKGANGEFEFPYG